MNRIQLADKAKLQVEGCHYLLYPRRGWYMGDKWIGYNFIQALEWLWENGY